MPVVKTEKFSFDGDEYIRKVYCDKDGDFSIKLPETVIEFTGKEKVYGKTMLEVFSNWDETIDKYKKSNTKQRKVIVYSIKTNDEISFAKGMAIQVWAGVYIEHKTHIPDQDPHIKYKDVGTKENFPWDIRSGRRFGISRMDGREIIDWTQERHDFFIMLYDAMESLVNKIDILKKKDKIINAIDCNLKLLE